MLSLRTLMAITALSVPFLSFAHDHEEEHDADENPQISVILNGAYHTASKKQEDYYLPGFMRAPEAELLSPGFAINEAELTFQGFISNSLYGYLAVALEQDGSDTELEIEEAYMRATLPVDLEITLGRFFSGIGYLNHHHTHQWSFSDAPLVYRAFFANQYNDDGVQLRWVSPCASRFWEVGVEVFPGRNFPSSNPENRVATVAVFSHLRDHYHHARWQIGTSYLHAGPRNREALLPGAEENSFLYSGNSNTLGIDFVWKWEPLSQKGGLMLQTEAYRRWERGLVSITSIVDDNEETRSGALYSTPWGAYFQAVYQFLPHWRVGWRYDWLASHNRERTNPVLIETLLSPDAHHPHQNAWMIDYSPTESTRFRIQYNRDHSYAALNQMLTLQFIVEFGSHAEHVF